MSEVWLTNPDLTPEHDFKALRAAVGTWAGSGWQVREDQSDPEVELADDPAAEPNRPVEAAPVDPDAVPTAEPDVDAGPDVVEPPAAPPAPKTDPVTTKKGD